MAKGPTLGRAPEGQHDRDPILSEKPPGQLPRRVHWRRRAAGWSYPLGGLVVGLVTWKLLVVLFDVPEFLVPPPERVFLTIIEQHEPLTRHSLATLQAVAMGYVTAVLVGTFLGVAMVSWRPIEQVIYPPIVAMQGLPKSALAPLFVIWFGFGTLPKVLITLLIAFFPIIVSTVTGFKSVPPELLNLGRSMGLSRIRLMRLIEFPTALPYIFSGLKVAIALAVIGTIVAEFVASDRGLGYLLIITTSRLDTGLTFAALIVLGSLGVLLYKVIEALERLTIPWHVSTRRDNPISSA